MTDLDAICYLKELKEYNREGRLLTPQNRASDTIWDCAFDHAIAALLGKQGIPDGCATFARNPNGSFSAYVDWDKARAAAPWGHVENVRVLYESGGWDFSFRVQVVPPQGTSPDEIHDVVAAAVRSVKNADPKGVEPAVTAACAEKGWQCRFLPRDAAGFPSTIYVSVSS